MTWPDTVGDAPLDARLRVALAEQDAEPDTVTNLLSRLTLPGVSDEQIAALPMPVSVMPHPRSAATHQCRTVRSFLGLLPAATELPSS